MRLRLMILGLCAASFLCFAPVAQAGVIRDAGSGIAKGTAIVAHTAANGTHAVADGATTAASATGGAVKSGASTTWDGIKATPSVVAHGTASAGKAIWHVIW
jgi:hypothetical protein